MTVEKPHFFQRKVTRRDVLDSMAVGFLAAYGGYKLKTSAIPRYFPSAPEAENRISNQVEAGVVAIYRGASIRTAPDLPNKTRFRSPDNRVNWDDIESVNGVALDGRQAFMVLNPSIVVGRNTTDDLENGFDWIKLSIKGKGDSSVKPYYVNHSTNTEEHVKLLGYAGYQTTTEGQTALGGIYKFGAEFLDPSDTNHVIVPENVDSMASDEMPVIWSNRIREQFGKIGQGLLIGNVEVVAGGNEKDVVEMREKNTRINVREYPSHEYGNGEGVKVVGTIAQGAVLKEVLLPPDDLLSGLYHYDFAAVLSEDLKGLLIDAEGRDIELPENRVYAIAKPYLLSH